MKVLLVDRVNTARLSHATKKNQATMMFLLKKHALSTKVIFSLIAMLKKWDWQPHYSISKSQCLDSFGTISYEKLMMVGFLKMCLLHQLLKGKIKNSKKKYLIILLIHPHLFKDTEADQKVFWLHQKIVPFHVDSSQSKI